MSHTSHIRTHDVIITRYFGKSLYHLRTLTCLNTYRRVTGNYQLITKQLNSVFLRINSPSILDMHIFSQCSHVINLEKKFFIFKNVLTFMTYFYAEFHMLIIHMYWLCSENRNTCIFRWGCTLSLYRTKHFIKILYIFKKFRHISKQISEVIFLVS